ncbi:hypothetical protein [Paractinoplanes maris]|uniref:hypothetical protein n=1 Tax=Paractinoplanes maris TaxID=1734446 RepID=UPI0020212B27|nr:hypothetical protein [Actinoplanes maris]
MSEFPASDLIERAAQAGFRMTTAGRQALAHPADDQIAEINAALDQGVTFDQFSTAEWDGEPLFEEMTR